MASSDTATVACFFSMLFERFPNFWRCCSCPLVRSVRGTLLVSLQHIYWNYFHLIVFSSWVFLWSGWGPQVLPLFVCNTIHISSKSSVLMDLLCIVWHIAASSTTWACLVKQPAADQAGCIKGLTSDSIHCSWLCTLTLGLVFTFYIVSYIVRYFLFL